MLFIECVIRCFGEIGVFGVGIGYFVIGFFEGFDYFGGVFENLDWFVVLFNGVYFIGS